MSIRTITQEEILQNGVKNLPNRPSSPSLYSGRAMSADELRAAFDRLPTLIAERFNELLYATGLFDSEDPRESFAELVATELFPNHSLAQFFMDVQSGAAAAYLNADGENALADVISELRAAILHLQGHAVTVEGEGDILSDVTVENNVVTLHKGLSSEEILSAAKAHADTPRGIVDKGCPLPVSGTSVYTAMREMERRCDPNGIVSRLENLENAARDVLYSYPDVDNTSASFRAPDNVLAHGALTRLGGVAKPSRNIFPEMLLTLYESEDLSITWDEESSCLLFDGTLRPADGAIRLVSFRAPTGQNHFRGTIYYRGGHIKNTGTNAPKLDFVTDSGKTGYFDFRESDYIRKNIVLTGATRFDHVALRAVDSTVVFEHYRCNIFLEDSMTPEAEANDMSYSPHSGLFLPSTIPAALTVRTPSVWTGKTTDRGEEKVSFPADKSYIRETMFVSLFAESDYPYSDLCCLSLLQGNGKEKTYTFKKGEWTTLEVISSYAQIEYRVYAADTPQNSAGYTVFVKDFCIELWDETYEDAAPFSLPAEQTFSFPSTFSRFQDRFLGTSDENCNYFDFEKHLFVEPFRKLTLDASLTWTQDSTVAGRFFAPFASPPAILTGAYFPRTILSPLSNEDSPDECVWFTENSVVLQSTLFSDAAQIKKFLTLYPIDILYEDIRTCSFLTDEETAFCAELILPTAPRAYMDLTDTEGNEAPAFTRIQYQISNNTTEELS